MPTLTAPTSLSKPPGGLGQAIRKSQEGPAKLKKYNGKLITAAKPADWFEVYEKQAVSLGELGGFVGWAATVDNSDEQAKSRQG